MVAKVPPCVPPLLGAAGLLRPAFDFFLLKFVLMWLPELLITETPALLFLVPMLPVIAVEATPWFALIAVLNFCDVCWNYFFICIDWLLFWGALTPFLRAGMLVWFLFVPLATEPG